MSKQNSETDQRQFWQMAIETWQSSGLPVRQFCKQEGLSEPSFYCWRRKLAQKADTEANADKKPTSKVAGSSDFIEVSIPESKSAGLELILTSGGVLRISPSFDSKTLSGVISVLHEAGLC